MHIADKHIGLIHLTIRTTGSNNLTILLHQFLYLLLTQEFTSHRTQLTNQLIHQLVAIAFQAPATLDIRTITMRKGEKGQGILA